MEDNTKETKLSADISSDDLVMPKMVASGDLSVDNKNKVEKEFNKNNIPLPSINDIFMLKGHEYKVIYINDGKHRFSCEPCKGVY